MYVSFNWLKEFVDLPGSTSAEELGLKLTMSTVEVEGTSSVADSLSGIVVGRVEKIKKHPDADKLKVCVVNDGKEKVKVVCGGVNVVDDMLVAFAPIGAEVRWHGEGELIELKKTKIRGVESSGMICAASEIGLNNIFSTSEKNEILDLSGMNIKVGQKLSEALDLDDTIFDIDNKSMTHRPDLWGHYGMAREVAALYSKKLPTYDPPRIKESKKSKVKVKVEDSKLCPRYSAVKLDGVVIGPSPKWLQKRLLAIGLRNINNIVDITNFVMFELGQPMHAFDADQLTGNTIQVRRANNGELFEAIDDSEYKLDNRDLVIADNKEVIALAGVMGGKNSEISEHTKSIVFESANFDATTVRRTSGRLGLRSDSSARFEKSQDPNNCELALRRAVQMVLEICPNAKVVSNVADISNFSLAQGPIDLDWDFLFNKLGQEIEKKQVIKILESLGFTVKEKKEGLKVGVPSWRATKDISIAEDLVEEVARIYGYDNIDPVMPLFSIDPPQPNALRKLERDMLDIAVKEMGYTEVYNYSFVSGQQITQTMGNVEEYIELDNPISKEKPYLRRSLLPNLLENTVKNIEYFDTVKLVEIGRVFESEYPGQRADNNGDDLLPRQDILFSAVYTYKKDENPFGTVRALLQRITQRLVLNNLELIQEAQAKAWQHPVRCAEIFVQQELVGDIYELHPQVTNNFGLSLRVGVIEINLSRLLEYIGNLKVYQRLPLYPEVERDIAFIVKNNITHRDILGLLDGEDELIKNIKLFDVYVGKNITTGYKSMAYRITYGSKTKTLTAEEVDKIQNKIVKKLKKEFDAEVSK